MPETTLKECAFLLDNEIDIQNPVSGYCVDSRAIKPGDLFFALPGFRADGHDFLAQAAASCASAAVVSASYQGPDYSLPLIKTPDVLLALQKLAKSSIACTRAKIVAVTGSVGKTTTKEFITTLLAKKFTVFQTPGNNNSQIGLPLAILNHTTGKEDILVLEMGLTEKGQIAKLVDIAPPDIALITTVALVHAENFESLSAIASAKAEIFGHSKTRFCIFDLEVAHHFQWPLLNSCEKVSFSTKSQDADYYLEESALLQQVFCKKSPLAVLMPLKVPGKHNRHNFLAAAIAARHVGMEWEEINNAISDLSLLERRLEIVEKKGITFINDSYNASEVSVKAALEAMPLPKKGGRKIAILGEMLELGKFSLQCHRSVGEFALNCVDFVFCYGLACSPIYDVWTSARRPVFLTDSWDLLVAKVLDELKDGDVVLLKGSRSKGMWKIIEEYF